MSAIPRVVISAPSSGHGKTAVAVGLLAAYAARGYRATGFKIGPDLVDAAYLGVAAGRPGRNLDPRLVGPGRIGPLFSHGAAALDIAVIEGTMGLFDGLAGRTDTESTAQVAGLLRAPVVLVLDVGSMGQSVAALVHGFRAYDELLWLGGVILNRVASTRHEELLRESLDDIGVPVLGALKRRALSGAGDAGAPLPPRMFGMAPVANGSIEATRAVRRLGEVIADAVDLERVMALSRSAPRLSSDPWSPADEVHGAAATNDLTNGARAGRRPIIAIAGGPAYSYGYPETAELLVAAGAEVVTFDPLRDEALPVGVNGLIVGSGLPEMYAEDLSINAKLRTAVAHLARSGRPIAAEGTGLVWLCKDYDGRPMCGVIDASARSTDVVVLGYREATAQTASTLLPAGAQVTGHKMHRTTVLPRASALPAWSWPGGPPEGFVVQGVHASYLGLHWAGAPEIASRLVAAARRLAGPGASQPVPVAAGPAGVSWPFDVPEQRGPATGVLAAPVPPTVAVPAASTVAVPAAPTVAAPASTVAVPAASSAAPRSAPPGPPSPAPVSAGPQIEAPVGPVGSPAAPASAPPGSPAAPASPAPASASSPASAPPDSDGDPSAPLSPAPPPGPKSEAA